MLGKARDSRSRRGFSPADIVNEIPILEWRHNTNNGYASRAFWVSAIGETGCLFANIGDSTNSSHWFNSPAGSVASNTFPNMWR